MAESSLAPPGAIPPARPAPRQPATTAVLSLRPQPWDPLDDPSGWLHDLELGRQALLPQPALRLPLQPPSPPLLLQLDRQAWPLQRLLHSPLLAWLTPEERQQAERLRRPEDRERQLLGRAGLRRLLGAWRQQPPQRVPLQRGSHGKPFCAGGPQFNLSHSGDLILLALHRHWRVGVDVEQLNRELDWRPLAARLFGKAECHQLQQLPAANQPHAFLQAWCRLEARLKATGLGLAGLEALRQQAELAAARAEGLENEAGPVPAGRPPGGLGLQADEQLWDLQLPAGYCGALSCLMGPEET